MPMETMLRIYFLQQWYALSDPAMENTLNEVELMRRFARLDLADEAIPDETTILKFRLLERNGLTAQMTNVINALEPRAGRTCLSRDETPARIHEGAPQGDREEHRAGVLADRADQPLSGETSLMN